MWPQSLLLRILKTCHYICLFNHYLLRVCVCMCMCLCACQYVCVDFKGQHLRSDSLISFFSIDCYYFGHTICSRLSGQQASGWFSCLCLLSMHKRNVIIGMHYRIWFLLWVLRVELRSLDFCDKRHYTLSHLMDPSLNILIRIIYEINCDLDRKSYISFACLHYL